MGTTWKSSPGPTDQVPADPRRQHVDAVAVETGQHCGPVAEHGHQIGGAASDDRPSLAMCPVGVGGRQPQSATVAERGHERIRQRSLGCSAPRPGHPAGSSGSRSEREKHVEFMGDVVAEQQARREVAAHPRGWSAQPLEVVEQFGGRARRGQRPCHRRVRAVERATVAEHLAPPRTPQPARCSPTTRCASTSWLVHRSHRLGRDQSSALKPRPAREPFVVAAQQVTHGHRDAPAERRFGRRAPGRPAADGRSRSGRSRSGGRRRGARAGQPARRSRIHQVLPVAYAHQQRRSDWRACRIADVVTIATASAAAIRLSNCPPGGTVEFQPVSAPVDGDHRKAAWRADDRHVPSAAAQEHTQQRPRRWRARAAAPQAAQPASRGRPVHDRALHDRDRDVVSRCGHPEHIHPAQAGAPQPDPAARRSSGAT